MNSRGFCVEPVFVPMEWGFYKCLGSFRKTCVLYTCHPPFRVDMVFFRLEWCLLWLSEYFWNVPNLLSFRRSKSKIEDRETKIHKSFFIFFCFSSIYLFVHFFISFGKGYDHEMHFWRVVWRVGGFSNLNCVTELFCNASESSIVIHSESVYLLSHFRLEGHWNLFPCSSNFSSGLSVLDKHLFSK
jgi:hypothetical protein